MDFQSIRRIRSGYSESGRNLGFRRQLRGWWSNRLEPVVAFKLVERSEYRYIDKNGPTRPKMVQIDREVRMKRGRIWRAGPVAHLGTSPKSATWPMPNQPANHRAQPELWEEGAARDPGCGYSSHTIGRQRPIWESTPIRTIWHNYMISLTLNDKIRLKGDKKWHFTKKSVAHWISRKPELSKNEEFSQK